MAIKLTTSWQLVAEGTSQVTSNCKGYVRLYMKYAPINSSSDTIYYEIRHYAYNPYGRYLAWEWTGNIDWSILSGTTARASGKFTQTPAIYSSDKKPENVINDTTQEVVRVSSSYTVTRNSDGTYSDTVKLKAPVYTSTVTTAENTITLPPYYTLTVNGNLDGSISSNTSSHGTFTISLNGGAHSSRITSYSNKVLEGTTWAIGGPYPNLGKTYNGYSAGDKSGTVTGNTTVTIKFSSTKYTITYALNGGTNGSGNPSSFYYGNTITLANPTRTGYTFNGWTTSGGTLSGSTLTPPASNITLTANWTINSYTNTIHHYAAGFIHGEGNSGGSRQFVFLGDTSFSANYGSTITYDSSKFTTIPNGYTWSAMGGASFNSSWIGYPLGQTFSQPAKNTAMQFDYYPIAYTITYELNGGTNNSSNPSTYNVLYGATFAEPTKEGYIFDGWTIDGVKVTGINQGLNNTFANASALYSGLATRTTGNKTVVANWKEIDQATARTKVNNAWVKGKVFVKKDGQWVKAKYLYTKVNNSWIKSK